MNLNDILAYLQKSPFNTNPAVLRSMLLQYKPYISSAESEVIVAYVMKNLHCINLEVVKTLCNNVVPSFDGLCFTAKQANSTVTLCNLGNIQWNGSYSLDGAIWNDYTFTETSSIASGLSISTSEEPIMFTFTDTNGVLDKNIITGYIKIDNSEVVNYTPKRRDGEDNTWDFDASNSSWTVEKIEGNSWRFTSSMWTQGGDTITEVGVSNSQGNTIILTEVEDKVYFKGLFEEAPDPQTGKMLRYDMSGSIAGSGNIMSLCSGDDYATANEIPYDYMFITLFTECFSLISAPSLPATILKPACYGMMFEWSGIVSAPSLPATTLTDMCYAAMFSKCASLTTVPKLPATTLANNCYMQMFNYCTSLYASLTSVSGTAEKEWKIPGEGVFSNTKSQLGMFAECLGVSDEGNMPGEEGQSYTYYTQNTPV